MQKDLLVQEKYKKSNKPATKGRGYKVTSITIEYYQHSSLKSEGLDLSKMVRDFLDDYLERNFPATLTKSKLIQGAENEED